MSSKGSKTSIVLSDGASVDILGSYDSVTIPAIAKSLAGIPRFLNHLEHPISVAQHSVLVSRASRHRLAGLLHDAHEALITDMPGPVKEAFDEICPNAWHVFEGYVATKIRKRFGVPVQMPDDVHAADIAIREMEVYHGTRHGKTFVYLGLNPNIGKNPDLWDGVWDEDTARRLFILEARMLGAY